MVRKQIQGQPDLTHREIAPRTEIKEEADLPITEIEDHSDPTDHKQKIEKIQETTDQTEGRIPPTEDRTPLTEKKVEAGMQ